MILKKVNKKLSTVKRAILLLGYDSETNDPIFVNGKTRPFLDVNVNKAQAELKKKYKLPTKALKFGQMSKEMQDLYSMNNKSDGNPLIIVHDTENPKYIEAQQQMAKMNIAIQTVTFFDMNKKNTYDDGTEVTGWNYFNIKKDDYLAMAEYLVSDDGLGLDKDGLDAIWGEIQNMSEGLMTNGDSVYKTMLIQMEDETEQEDILAQITAEIDSYGTEE